MKSSIKTFLFARRCRDRCFGGDAHAGCCSFEQQGAIRTAIARAITTARARTGSIRTASISTVITTTTRLTLPGGRRSTRGNTALIAAGNTPAKTTLTTLRPQLGRPSPRAAILFFRIIAVFFPSGVAFPVSRRTVGSVSKGRREEPAEIAVCPRAPFEPDPGDTGEGMG